jgi:hypothetical protein
VREAFDILLEGHELLDVLVLTGREDGVIYYYAIDRGVSVGGEDGIFEVFAV